MINVSDIVVDPDFVQTFSVTRSAGVFGLGGWVESAPTVLSLSGTVTVANEKDLQQVPEGDRVMGAMMFYSPSQIYVTRNGDTPGISDTITWQGELYKVVRVWPYLDYGYYKAYAYRMSGE